MRLQHLWIAAIASLMIGAGVAVAAGSFHLIDYAVTGSATSGGGAYILSGTAGEPYGQVLSGSGYTLYSGTAEVHQSERPDMFLPLLSR